ncbi:MAG: PAS sensor protein [Sulfuricurvum sp. GWF2_44_89]|uniref:PAS sensor protein n=1 Tax=Sulfuricurvum kujiense TaxID=148813 RepID=A0A2D3WFI1_9BACT|nr:MULTISPECIES: PAS domain-containing protein [Sulfuricurvum]OHD78112.1 MAG: PAS sensor protein [Sulfuricurvum sp. GWF2_44_89]OHD94598.1 MAG: PAS sensor protein [Sulfuricurvum sp. RIFOXYD12_FULL_44_77]OHD99198.1 MAG: PAS sensor protein [Sulfuricurvum sp. RIFOXYD2_FULL_44_160]DAB38665.1 MAG TPA: PAS sensor protein [Sulfuricurvum kujiense]
MAGNELTFSDDTFIVSKTDVKGKITYGNELFISMSGYSEEELLYAPHNILRHSDMPASVFKLLWTRIQSREEVFAYVINKTKNNDYYWVFAHVTPSFDAQGNIIGYHSVRRKPKKEALSIIQPLYSSMLRAEKIGGIAAGEKILLAALDQMKVTYDEFILSH